MGIERYPSLPGRIEAIALDPTGERAAVASGQAGPSAYADEPPGHHLHLYRVQAGRLDRDKSLPLLAYGAGRRTSGTVRWQFRATRAAFRDERTLLVLRSVQGFPPDPPLMGETTELIGIDLETGEEVGHYQIPSYDYHPSLVPLSPNHALLGRVKTAVCVDVTCFREVWNAQTVGDRGGALGVDEDPDEYVAPNGYAYDARAGRLWVLSGRFNEAFLQCYRLDRQNLTFARLWRRSVLEGHDPAGLCLNPGGRGVTASFQIVDDLVDLWGRPIADWVQAQEGLLARRLELGEAPAPPRTARLGCLALLSEGEAKRIDVYSEFGCDFILDAAVAEHKSAKLRVVVVLLSNDDPLEDNLKKYGEEQGIKRFVDPKDIAALAVFLASDAGKSISGQVLPIDNDSHQAS